MDNGTGGLTKELQDSLKYLILRWHGLILACNCNEKVALLHGA